MENEETRESKPRRKRTASGWTEIAKYVYNEKRGYAFHSQSVSRASRSPRPSKIKDWLIQHGINGELPDGFDIYEWKKQYGLLEEGEKRPERPKGKRGDNPEFGNFLKHVREKVMKMSRARVGELVNTSAGHILRWENGFRPVKSTQYLLFDQIIKVCDEDVLLYRYLPEGWNSIFPDEYKSSRGWVRYKDDTDEREMLVPPRFADIFEEEPVFEGDTVTEVEPRIIRKKTLRTKEKEEEHLAEIAEKQRIKGLEREQARKDRERQFIKVREEVLKNEKQIISLVASYGKLDSKLDWISKQVSEMVQEEKDQIVKTQSKYITMLEEKVSALEAQVEELKNNSSEKE